MPFDREEEFAGGLVTPEQAEREEAIRKLRAALDEGAEEDAADALERAKAPTTPREVPKGPERDPADPSAL